MYGLVYHHLTGGGQRLFHRHKKESSPKIIWSSEVIGSVNPDVSIATLLVFPVKERGHSTFGAKIKSVVDRDPSSTDYTSYRPVDAAPAPL